MIAGGAGAGRAGRPRGLRPIADGSAALRGVASASCPRRSSPAPPAASAARWPRASPSAAGGWCSTPAAPRRSRTRGRELAPRTDVVAIPGDVADAAHRGALVEACGGALDALVNNASSLGPSPLPALAELPLDALADVLRVNAIAPLGLIQRALPLLAPRARGSSTSRSDAAVEAYPGWGGYGAAKAALEQLSRVLAAEHPDLRVYAFDPGDMRTQMHQDAYPGEDISDRPPPEESVPALLRLLEERRAERAIPPRSCVIEAAARSRRATLEAHAPPAARDAVRLLVAGLPPGGRPPRALRRAAGRAAPGDVLVVNTSATLPAALPARREDGSVLRAALLHPAARRARPLGGRAAARRPAPCTTGARGGAALPAGATARLLEPYRGSRLWVAELAIDGPLLPTWTPRRADPLRARPRRAGRSRPTRPSSPQSPEARRCRAPGGRSPRGRRPADRARRRRRAARPPHRRLVARARRGPYPERFHVPGATAARVRPRGAPAAG